MSRGQDWVTLFTTTSLIVFWLGTGALVFSWTRDSNAYERRCSAAHGLVFERGDTRYCIRDGLVVSLPPEVKP